MCETLMLCFRDLVTQPGETIAFHLALIQRYGHCWWGWWKKPIENVPVDLVQGLASQRNGRSPAILLYDCGRYKLYRARLDGVAIAPGEGTVSSPDVEKTPEYYDHLRLSLWLKLGAISEITEATTRMKELTYVGFPSWPQESLYEAYKGKPIGSWEELDQTTVTLWHLNGPDDLCRY